MRANTMSNPPTQKLIRAWIPIDLYTFMQAQIDQGKYKDFSDMINKLLDREYQKTLTVQKVLTQPQSNLDHLDNPDYIHNNY